VRARQAIWLKSVRLHKYAAVLVGQPLADLLGATDEQLLALGFASGAARKLRASLRDSPWARPAPAVAEPAAGDAAAPDAHSEHLPPNPLARELSASNAPSSIPLPTVSHSPAAVTRVTCFNCGGSHLGTVCKEARPEREYQMTYLV
jgi:hypothetical protein